MEGIIRVSPRRYTWLLALLLSLSACRPGGTAAPTATITPLPTLQPVTIAITPGLLPFVAELQRCAAAQPGMALLVNETSAPFLFAEPFDLALRLGPPPESITWAAPVGEESLLVVVHSENPVNALTTEQLSSLYQGEIQNWQELGGPDQAIQPWVYTESDEARQLLEEALPGIGPPTTHARLAPDPAGMLAGVAADPGALGTLPSRWLNSQVKSLELETGLAQALRAPVLALAPAEPEGMVRVFVHCLQSGSIP